MTTLATTIFNTSFKDEFTHITEYMLAAFEGEPESKIRTVMDNILTLMMRDMQDNHYVMISDTGAVNETIALGEYLRSIKSDNRTNLIVAYCEVSTFNPIREKSLNTVDQGKLWQATRRKVANIFRQSLPNLTPIGLNALLEDENATIPAQPEFNGLTIETVGAFPFRKRVSAHSLRYDQQEQANHWINVVAGAIVCHYHTFLEIKQNRILSLAINKTRKELQKSPEALNAVNSDMMHSMMLNTYEAASRVHD